VELSLYQYSLIVVGAPLIGALLSGLGMRLGRSFAHTVTNLGVGISFLISCLILKQLIQDENLSLNVNIYTWAQISDATFSIGFLIDRLTAVMMVVVTSVSLLVHVYTIGYMREDPGYQRFFSYISLFTFSMLMLVMSNNCLQLFFGWEAVGLVSYLLIGFWYEKESALFANLKAFLVNRLGDFGFILGIAGIWMVFGTLDYATIFSYVSQAAEHSPIISLAGIKLPLLEVITLGLFVGAMGKSAQVPLHIWLPDSMEGPTPISALIHAATMVTAGVFMVSRMSPIFEYAPTTLSVILVIGATTGFFMGLLGMVQKDIKRIIAYSTLSQLGYMVAALGLSAYSLAMFHLTTHAFFKALLFLGAGSVIMGMHHEQNIFRMGGLWRYLPISYVCMWIGTLALIGFPLFSGFYSKDFILMALEHSNIPGIAYAYPLLLAGVFITAFYSFRLLFVLFHGEEHFDNHTREHIHESGPVIYLPLILLAIPSVILGAWIAEPLLNGFFAKAIFSQAAHTIMLDLAKDYHGYGEMALHGVKQLPFLLVISGFITAWLMYIKAPKLAYKAARLFAAPYWVLNHKYGFDLFNEKIIIPTAQNLGSFFWRFGDRFIIDTIFVQGLMSLVQKTGILLARLQNGYLYQYAFAMCLGLIGLLAWIVYLFVR
jgi:NADH-quinone oxidoreductase subunit L